MYVFFLNGGQTCDRGAEREKKAYFWNILLSISVSNITLQFQYLHLLSTDQIFQSVIHFLKLLFVVWFQVHLFFLFEYLWYQKIFPGPIFYDKKNVILFQIKHQTDSTWNMCDYNFCLIDQQKSAGIISSSDTAISSLS